jgi:anaerobic ribonucleoside-triphosphate reductase activating protein
LSILVPVVSTGITLNEVPDKIAYFIELGSCTQRCKGCHSEELWEEVESPTSLEDVLRGAENAIESGANAIVLMGGTCNKMSTPDLLKLLDDLSEIAPTCLYSGLDDEETNTYIAEHSGITWLKTGSYKAELGGLSSPTTNQRFYRKETDVIYDKYQFVRMKNRFVDCTHLFQT